MSISVAAVVCTLALNCTYSFVKVIDGDTIGVRSERIRMLEHNAPEIDGKCKKESRLARLSRARLAELIQGKQLIIDRQGRDKYGRTLAKLRVNGADLGSNLASEGLTQVWNGTRKDWCK